MYFVKKDEIPSFGELSQSYAEDVVILRKEELREICEYIFELESAALDGEPMPPKLHNFSVLWDFCKD